MPMIYDRRNPQPRPDEDKGSATGSILSGLLSAAGAVAAPFTGGASLAIPMAAGIGQAAAGGGDAGMQSASSATERFVQTLSMPPPRRQRDYGGESLRDQATFEQLAELKEPGTDDSWDRHMRRRLIMQLAGAQGPLYR